MSWGDINGMATITVVIINQKWPLDETTQSVLLTQVLCDSLIKSEKYGIQFHPEIVNNKKWYVVDTNGKFVES